MTGKSPTTLTGDSLRGRLARHKLLTAAAAVGVIILAGAIQIVIAAISLQDAASNLSRVVSISHGGNALTDAGIRQQIEGSISTSGDDFSRAEACLWLWNPILGHIGWLPGVGKEAVAAYPIAATGSKLASGATRIFDGLSAVWPALNHHPGRGGLMRRVAPGLAGGVNDFQAAAKDFAAAQTDVNNVPTDTGSYTINSKMRTVRNALPKLQNAALWLSVAPAILGDQGPSRILLVWENPDQIRPTGGFIPAANFLTIRQGAVQDQAFGSFFANEPQTQEPLPESTYTGEGSFLFEDSNWSPDFPLTARYERWMFGLATHQWAPIVIDVSGASAILTATGPIYVAAYHQWVNAANVAYWIEYYHLLYVRHTQLNASDTKSQRFLAELFTAIVSHIQRLKPSGLLSLANGFHTAVGQQTLMMYARDPRIEMAMRSLGAAGSIGPVPNDSLLIVDDNLSYNKINPYIDESASYDVYVRPNLTASAVLRIRYHNRRSPANLYGNGPFYAGFSKHAYQDWVRVYIPPRARLHSQTGFDLCTTYQEYGCFWAPQPAYGMTQLAADLLLPEFQTQWATFRYDLPSGIFSAGGPGQYRLTIMRQPSTNIKSVHVTVHAGAGMSVGRPGQTAQSFTVQLRHVRTDIQTRIFGASGSPSAMVLSHGPWTDPWLPSAEFTAPGHTF